MTVPPLVERELLAGGRRKSFFWLRGALALVAGLQGYDLLNARSVTPGVGGGELLQEMAGLLFVVALLMGFMAADSINRERREGTLGLLLLTGLTPMQIVRGKLLSCGVTSFLVLLGALPAVMFPVLLGGARGSDGVMIGLGVLNALFVSLAAGLWMSALFRERLYALPATLALVGGLAFGAEVFGAAFFGPRAVDPMRLFGLGGWITTAHLPAPLSLRFGLFVLWLGFAHAAGWALLLAAAGTLSRNWQDKPLRHVRPPSEPDQWADWTRPAPKPAPPGEVSPAPPPLPLPDPRPWDGDPIRWRMEQLGSPRAILWIAVFVDLLAQFGALGGLFNLRTSVSGSWGLFSFMGLIVVLPVSGSLAWAGARFFQHTTRQQDLELLLTTPVGGATILSGQWRVLWRSLRWPLFAVLALVTPAGISLAYDFTSGHAYAVDEVLPAFLVGINLVVEAIALCWVGMRFGLRARNLISAVVWTIAVVEVLPMALVIAGLWLWTALGAVPTSYAGSPSLSLMVAALGFFLVKNLAFAVGTPFRLRRELRLGARAPARLAHTWP